MKETDSFENLHEFVDTIVYDAISVIPHIQQHISSLLGFFKTYFPENSSKYDWLRDPFNAPAPTGFSSAEEDQFIDMTSDSTLRLRFTSQTLSEFWPSVEGEYPLLGQRAMGILLPFATSYLCETGFSAVAAIKTKYRSQLNIEQELRLQYHASNLASKSCALKNVLIIAINHNFLILIKMKEKISSYCFVGYILCS